MVHTDAGGLYARYRSLSRKVRQNRRLFNLSHGSASANQTTRYQIYLIINKK